MAGQPSPAPSATVVRAALLLSIVAAAVGGRYTPVTGCPVYAGNGQECAGRGTCVQDSGGFTCHCVSGYIHADCSTADFCMKNCSGVGTCIRPPAHVLHLQPNTPGTCACKAGYKGAYCDQIEELNVPQPGCDNWCSGQGRCVCDSPDDYVLQQRRVRVFDANGFAEPDQIVTERVSRSMSLLSASSGNNCRCECRAGFAGSDCSAAEPVGCPASCSGHGSCGPLCSGVRCQTDTGYGCTCDPGFTGDDCGTAVSTCPDSCSGHGTCVDGACTCNVGFGGESCGMTVSAPNPPASPPPPPLPPSPPPSPVHAVTPSRSSAAKSSARSSSLLQLTDEAPSTDLAHEASSFLRSFMSRLTTATLVTIPAEDGSGRQCDFGCSGHGLCSPLGECQCVGDFAPPDCSRILADCPSNCSGHGHCMTGGVCQCMAGAYGPACDRVKISLNEKMAPNSTCPSACSGHGTCDNGECTCDSGYVGSDCSILQHGVALTAQCANSCSGHGHCVTTLPITPRITATPAPIASAVAALTAESAPAELPPSSLLDRLLQRRGARLVATEANADMPDAPPAELLRRVRTPAAAAAARAAQQASLLTSTLGAQCVCDNGFGGADCSELSYSCPHNCSGAGLCLSDPPTNQASFPVRAPADKVGAEPSCHCMSGHSGDACELREPRCPNYCSGHGTCVHQVSDWSGQTSTAQCNCAPGYAGTDCSASCPLLCSGHGTCAMTNGTAACTCATGYAGAGCNTTVVCQNDCSSHGTCIEGVCSCDTGFSGSDCSFSAAR